MNHPIFARFYARVSPMMDRGGMIEHRRRLLAGLAGRVIEVGAGNGLNFAHYPSAVTGVLAVEPEPSLRELARQAAENAAVPVEVVDGVAERLPIGDESVDAAVVCLVLCSVPDQAAVLRELRRVVRPGGELRFLEHVRAESPGLRRVQRLLDGTFFWPMLGGGCHAGRDTVAAIENAGFTVERLDRLGFPESRIALPTSPHALGIAINPG